MVIQLIYNKDIYIEAEGIDFWGRTIYRNRNTGEEYKSINLNDGKLYTCTASGEPDIPISDNIRLIFIDETINSIMADKISDVIIDNEFGYDTRIYFNNMAYEFNDNQYKIINNIKASKYFEYANDATVSMSFEGSLYNSLNGYSKPSIYNELDKIVNQYGFYFEFGNAWNMTLYKI